MVVGGFKVMKVGQDSTVEEVWSLSSSLNLEACWSGMLSGGNRFLEPAAIKINEELLSNFALIDII